MQLNKITRSSDQNNFDQLRLIAASLVMLCHCYPLALGTATVTEPVSILTRGYESFGSLSVSIFFIISGYLITKSWSNKPKLTNFIWKRVLRIYPGLIVAILFTTFFIGPLVSSLNLKEYLLNINLSSMIKSIIFLRQDYLPGVFYNNIYPWAVNGSLWTLLTEAAMYLMTAFLGLSGILKKKWPVVIFILLILASDLNFHFERITSFPVEANIICIVYYLIGMCCFLYKDRINYSSIVSFALLLIWIISFHTTFYRTIAYVSIPYIILYCAFTPTKYLRKLVDKGDYSYGLYIYAFPIQQTIVYFFKNTITPIELLIIAYPLTFLIAFLSWNFIERKALQFKKILGYRAEDSVDLIPKSRSEQ